MPRIGNRRKKRRTHVKDVSEEEQSAPRSMIVRRGVVADTIGKLISDMRVVMEPYTARNLQERTKTRMRDLLAVASPLRVTHLLTLSQDSRGTPTLRTVRVPRGPTLSFHVQHYSLAADVRATQKRPVAVQTHLRHAPLVVLNNLAKQPIVAAMLQNMFPSINVASVKLAACRRVVLFSYDDDDETIHFRHYLVSASPVDLSRPVRMLVKSKVPNLHRFKDISEVMAQEIGAGSDSEAEDPDEARVVLPQDLAGRGNRCSHRSAIRLKEIGPRMQLQLVKIEEGVCDGAVIYNRFVSKTPDEVEEIRKRHADRDALKVQRRRVQEENVAKKKQAALEKKQRKLMRREQAGHDSGSSENGSDGDECQDTDDEEWYRREVGEEPDEHDVGHKRRRRNR